MVYDRASNPWIIAMSEIILANEPAIRMVIFFAILGSMMLWEAIAPRRAHAVSRWPRWLNNLGISALNTVFLRLLFPTAVVGLALLGEQRGWGLLNAVTLPAWLAVAISVVALDLAIYLQHVLFHAAPALWRLHRMHHADLDFDTTTGIRFHPIEILLSAGIRFAVVAALGTPAIGVIIFEVVLNGTALFNHGNVRMPLRLDRWLRWIVVTPDMHRVHHSVVASETNSNFGFNLPWWDRLFGTYRDQPAAGHDGMTIGIEAFRNPRELWLDMMLVQPFRGAAGPYPINRDGGRE